MHASTSHMHAYVCMYACMLRSSGVCACTVYIACIYIIVIFNEYNYVYTCWGTQLVVTDCCLSLLLLFVQLLYGACIRQYVTMVCDKISSGYLTV